jgi:hypothetical protein
MDACFIKCMGWTFKISMLILTNGNNKDIPIAFGMFDEETIKNYVAFLLAVMSLYGCWMGEFLNRPTTVIVTDRHASLTSACAQALPLARHRYDVRHIHENIKANPLLNKGDTGIIWKLHKAITKKEFNDLFVEWYKTNPAAAAYAAEIPSAIWATYTAKEEPNPFYLIRLIGQQAAEQEMSRLKKLEVRHQLPLHAVANFCSMFAGIIDERIADCAKYKDDPKKLLTIYADQKLCQIVQSVQPYKITRDLGAKMYEVQHERAKPGIGVRLVNWAEKTCSCLRMQLEGLPCVHLVCVYKQTCSKDKQTMVHLLDQLG